MIIQIDPNFASSFRVRLEIAGLLHNNVLNLFKETHPEYYSLIRHGDVLQILEDDYIQYVFLIYKKGSDVRLFYQKYNIPEDFFGDFHVDYWNHINYKNLFNSMGFLCHIYIDFIRIPEVYRERYKPLRPDLEFYRNHDKFNTIPEDELNLRYFRAKNLIYIFHCYEEKPQRLSIYRTITIDAPSRWKTIYCIVKLLGLHKRAVVTANHPLRLLERKEFELTD